MTHIPQRTCIGCKQVFAQAEMIAVCRLPDRKVVVMNSGTDMRKQGRCAYLCKKEKCVNSAKNRKPKNGLQYTLKIADNPEIWEDIIKSL